MRYVFAVQLLVILASLLATPAADAANIELKQVDAGAALVTIEGDLELADIELFRSKVAPLSRATVEFRSDGGSLLAGIRIGMLIRVNNFNTVVPDAAQCASACAVAWLGGARRFLGAGAKVGFHAAYVQKAGAATESGPGNAVLGAYLDQIGLPEDAIVYITQAAPSSMKWMSLDEAAQHGIEVALLPPPDAAPPPDPNVAASQEPQQGSPAGRAAGLAVSLAALWSQPNAQVLRGLDELYADRVFYHGKLSTRQAVLLDKRRFAERWPHRSYKIRPHSVTTSCNAASQMCRVQGVIERELANPAANTKSSDVATFDLGVTRSGSTLRIASETSSVSKPSDGADDLDPITSVRRSLGGLERWLAQRMRPPSSGAGTADGQVRPSAPVRH